MTGNNTADSGEAETTALSLDTIYNEKIRPSVLGHCVPKKTPRGVLVIAQPGAGKSAHLQKLRTSDDLISAAVINGDHLHYLNPTFSPAFMANPFELQGFKRDTSAGWFESLLNEVTDRSLDMVMEITPKAIPQILNLAEELKGKGYGRIDVHCVAVDIRKSELGVAHRLEGALTRDTADTHWVPVASQRQQHEMLATSVEILQRVKSVDQVYVFNRVGECLNPGDNPKKLAQAAVNRETARPWSVVEAQSHAREWCEVAHSMTMRPSSSATKPDWYQEYILNAVEAARTPGAHPASKRVNGQSPLFA